MGKQLSVKPKQSRSLEAFRRKPSNLLAAVIRRSLLASAGLVLAQPFGSVLASPQGGDVVAGQGTIAQPNANTTIITQQSQNVAIDWQSFNLAQQDLVRFDQPNSSAAALNRILNGSPTQILGTIQSNGKVFLINPRGIIFGNGSRVNVGALFASSLDITNHDFMSGNYKFAAAPGSAPGAIVNQGQIEAAIGGSVTMVGGSASNEGVITATLGQVNLGAGTEAVVDFAGDGLIHFAVSGEAAQQVADAAVANSGAINAGEVTLSARAARSVFDNVINNTGTIKAGRIDRSGGKIRLVGIGGSVRNSGTLDASGTSGGGISVVADGNVDVLGTITADATTGTGGIVSITSGDTTILDSGSHVSAASTDGQGGRVEVLGPQVGLVGDAVVDASGGTGGGTVLVGGELSGGGVTPTSRAVFVGTDATIRADATHNGDGGTVIVWSDEVSRVYGSLSARGGAQGGNGGFVETSSAGFLDVTRAPDINAPLGSGGEWLIDPDDIEIVDAGDDDFSNSADGPNFTFTSNGAVSRLNVSTLVDALSFNATVRVVTNNSNASGLGNITLSADLDYNGIGSSNLILEAINDIVINADITDSDATNDILNLTLSANTDNGSGGGVIIANDVTIDLGGGDFTVGNTADGFAAGNSTIDAGNVSIDVTGSIALGNVNATNNLTAVADGDITQNASTSLDVTNTSSFNTSANIVLTNTANDFRSITLSGDSATIVDNNAIVLAGTTLSNLTVTAGGAANENITQSGALNITNTADLTALDASIVLTTGTNDFNTLSLSASEANIADDNAVVLGVSTLSNLTVTAGGMANEDITQSGAVMVSNTATLTAVNASIVLNNSTNDFNTLSLSASEANIADDNAVVLGASTLSNLTVTASGMANENITQTGTLNITNTADLTAANASIVLNNSTNDFNTLSLSASEANIVDDNAVVLGASTLSNLTVTAGGAANENITQTGALNISNTATLTAANASIVLNNGTNDFNTLALTTTEANIADDTGIVLAGTTLSNLTVTAGGAANENITQTGGLNITNTADLTAANASIVLNNSTNDFNTLLLSASEANIVDDNAVVLGASTLSNLTVTAGGMANEDITQSGAVMVSNTADLTAANASIVLNNGTNDFNTLSLSASEANIADDNAVVLGASTLNNLTVTAGGAANEDITQSGAVMVSNTADLTAANASIVLNNSTNDFNTLLLSASEANIVDDNAVVLGVSTLSNLTVTAGGMANENITQTGTLNITNTADLTAANASIVLNNSTNDFNTLSLSASEANIVDDNAVVLGASTLSNLTVTAGGAANENITQTGALNISNTATLTAANASIVLNNGTNDFNTLALTTTEANIADDTGIVLAGTTLSNLTVTAGGAANENITQTGGLNITNTADLTAANASIVLNNSTNDFNTLSLSASEADIADDNAVVLGASTLSNLTVTAGGMVNEDITQSGAVMVSNTATLTAANASIVLNNSTNDFNTLSLSASEANIADDNAVVLGASTLSNLTVTAGGMVNEDITQSGAVMVSNTATLTAANASIVLNNSTNDFNTLLLSASEANIVDDNAVVLGVSTLSNLTVTAGGMANEDITQSGAVMVSNTADLTAANASIVLNNGTNDFNTLSLSASEANIADDNAVMLGVSTLSNLTVTAGGMANEDITQSGAVMVSNTATLTAANASIVLNNSTNDFNTLSLSASEADIADDNAVVLGASTLSNLTVTAGGMVNEDITQSGAVMVSNTATLTAANASIVLNNGTNDFNTLLLSASEADIADDNAVVLGASTLSNLTVTAGGMANEDITQSGAVMVSNTATLTAANASIVLNNSTNDFNTLALTTTEANIADDTGIVLAGTTLSNLTVTAGGAANENITQTGALNITNTATLTAANASIVLNNSTNDFNTLSLSASEADIADDNAVVLGASTLSNLTVTAGGMVNEDITQSGAVMVSNTATLTAANASIVLNNGTNDFNTLALTTTEANIADDTGIVLAGTTLSNLTVTAGGAANENITQTGALNITNTATLTAANASIVLNNSTNDFNTLSLSASEADIADDNAVVLGASTLSNLTVTAGGMANEDITQSGAVMVSNTATLTAANASIVLNNGTNDFNTLALTTTEANIADDTGIVLAGTTLSNLTVTAGGAANENITQTGALNITNTATLTAANASIVLNNSTNDFNTLLLSASEADIADDNAVVLGASTLNNLTVTAGGAANENITQTGALNISNTADLTAANASIVLNNGTNDFNTLLLSASEANIVDDNAVVLGASTLSNLTVTAGGMANENITQTGALNITNTATLTAANASIVLNNGTNDFNTLALTTTEANIADDTGIVLAGTTLSNLTVTAGGAANENITQTGGLNITNTADLTAANASIVLNNSTNDFNTLLLSASEANIVDDNAVVLGASTLSNLTVTAGGMANEDITQSGAVMVSNTADLTAANASIVLNNGTNDFNTLALTTTEANIADDTGIVLAGTTLSNLTVTAGGAANENITQTGALHITNTADLTAANASIVLNNSTNDFNTLSLSASEANIADDNAVVLGASTLSNLTVTAGGMANEDITQSGAVMVSNTADLTAANASIVLNNGTNDFNTLALTTTEANIADDTGIVLAGTTLSNLTVTAGGAANENITQTGALNITNTATLTAANASIVLNNGTNDFNTLSLSASEANIADDNAVVLGVSTLSNLTVTAGGMVNEDITQSGAVMVSNTADLTAANASIVLNNGTNDFNTLALTTTEANIADDTGIVLAGTTLSNLTVTAGGAANENITQTGALHITNTADLTAANASIVLNNSTNDFNTLSLSASEANIADDNAVVLGASTLSNLTVTAGGMASEDITQSGAVMVSNTATLTAANASIVLNNSTNDFNTLSLSASEANIADDNAVVLGTSTLSNLTVTAGGMANEDITQSGTVMVSNTAILTAANASIVLTTGTNDFNTLSLSASEANVTDTNAVVLGTSDLSNLTVTAGGDITQSGALIIGNTAALTADNADIVLTTPTNDFNIATLVAANATVVDANDINIGGSNLTHNLTVTASSGNIIGTALSVANTATFNATADVILTNTTNDLNNVMIQQAVNVNIVDGVGNLTLQNSTITGTLTANTTAAGSVLAVAAGNTVNVTGMATLTSANSVSVNGTLTSNGANITATGGSFVTGGNSSISTGASNFTVTATDAMLGGANGSITGNNSVLLQPVAANGMVSLGNATGGLNLTAAELLTLNDAFTNVTIGNDGNVTTGGAVVFPEAVITLNSNVILSTGNNSFDVNGTTGSLVVNGGILDNNTTPGSFTSNLTISDAVTVNGNVVADAINLQAINFNTAATLRTDTLTLNGAVTGSNQLALQREILADVDIGGANETFLGAPTISQFGGFAGDLIIGGNDAPTNVSNFTVGNLAVSSPFNTGAGNTTVFSQGNVNFLAGGQISAGTGVNLIALGDGLGVANGDIVDAGDASVAPDGFLNAPNVVAIAFGNISSPTPFTVNATMVAAATGADLSPANTEILDGDIMTALGGGASTDIIDILMALSNNNNLPSGLQAAAQEALVQVQANIVDNASAIPDPNTEIEEIVVIDNSSLETLDQISLIQIEEGTTLPWYMRDDVPLIEESQEVWEEFIESVTQGYPEDRKSVVAEAIRAYYRQGQLEDAIDGGDSSSTDDQLGEDDSRVAPGTPQGALTGDGDEPWATLRYVGMPWLKGGIGVDASNWRHAPLAV
ncbi:MAG: filamentous hemagglutinin N-terminal domain-containing protein [Gammaproteobacteria bacterium]|nr:filamentous hemagglutinin N-terminal domain-containing protein [Gammaproteobacteria bacterium]